MNDTYSPSNTIYFTEGAVPGTRHGKIHHKFVIDKFIYKGKTDFQNILIFENFAYGKVLVLDGIVQLSESDEFIYHEMLTHPYILSHPDPKRVLIIGGGDGGTLREVVKHDIEECVMVDIDQKVVELCQQHLPFISDGAFQHHNAKVLFEDGLAFMKKYNNHFDVVIIDCNDAIGPSEKLFSRAFYQDIGTALTENGVCAFQMGAFMDFDFLQEMHDNLKSVFKYTVANRLTMPCYHCGEYCFMGASNAIDFKNIPADVMTKRITSFTEKNNLRYYNAGIHQASQCLANNMILK